MVSVSNSKHLKTHATFIITIPRRYPCRKDSLIIYKTMDGSGVPMRITCGGGRHMTEVMPGSVAYVKFQSDGANRYRYRGFSATFNAEGMSTMLVHVYTYTIIVM